MTMKRVMSALVMAACITPAWPAAAEQTQSQGSTQNQARTQTPDRPNAQAPDRPNAGAAAASPARARATNNAMTATTFIERARASNAFEIQSSRLAVEKATQPALKSFARMMIDDHTNADQRMAALVRDRGQPAMASVPLEPQQRSNLQALQTASGSEFDRLYARIQQEAHEQTVQLFEQYAENGTDERLRGFARENLPALRRHLEQIRGLNR